MTVLAASALAALLLAACGGSSSPSSGTSSSSTTSKKPVPLAFFLPAENGYIQAVADGARKGAEEAGGQIVQTFVGDGTPTTTSKQILDATTSGKFKGFLVYPANSLMNPAIERAIAGGVRVAVVEGTTSENQLKTSSLPGVVISTTESYQTRVDGMAQLIVGACGRLDPCNVAWMLGFAQNPGDVQVLDGIKAQLASQPSIRLVATTAGNYATPAAKAAAANVLTAHPDLNVFATNDDDMTYGVQLAAQQAGKTGIKLIGVGASELGCKQVKAGAWVGTTNQVPFDAGRQGAKALVEEIQTGSYDGPRLWDPLVQLKIPAVTTHDNADTCPAQWHQ